MIYEHTVQLKLATKKDLLIAKGLLRVGQPYYVRDVETGLFKGPYMIDAFTSSTNLKKKFTEGILYTPVVAFDFFIENTLQQNDLKKRVHGK